MKYAIVYTSNTGNTTTLANTIKEEMNDMQCEYFGQPCEQAKDADILCVGFWTDKGTCPEIITDFLKGLHHKKLLLFGTAGFGGDQSYFDRILANVEKNIADDNIVLAKFMCQGRMPLAVRQRYEKMVLQKPDLQAMLDNFDNALRHPDQDDMDMLRKLVRKFVK